MSAKRNYGMGTIRQRPNGSWEMRVRINGKQRSFSGKTKKEALERARQAESDFMNGNYVEPSKQTVAQWLNTWLKLYCNNHAPSTIVKYEQQVRIHLVPSIGHIVLQQGVDYKTLSAMLGHEDVAFTMNQYGHVTEAMRNEAANRMQSLICSM